MSDPTHQHDYRATYVGGRSALKCLHCNAETTMDQLPLAAAMRAMGLEIEITDVETGVSMTYKDKGEN